MKINVISKPNGVGLDQDFNIIKSLLPQHEVVLVDWEKNVYKKADLNIHLERISSQFINIAPKNICIPNPEWFDSNGVKFIGAMDAFFCKTADTYRIFSAKHDNCIYTSFTSRDMRDKSFKKKREFLHLAGHSSHKNTEAVFKCFTTYMPLPKLHLYKHSKTEGYYSTKNIDFVRERVSDAEIKAAMNENLFHICPSEYEGFGHYINEAKSAGAIILTVDSPPMNELVKKEFGVMADGYSSGFQNFGKLTKVRATELFQGISKMLKFSDSQLKEMSEKAISDYQDNDLFFKYMFTNSIKQL